METRTDRADDVDRGRDTGRLPGVDRSDLADLAIVGGGPAGLATAIGAARRGLRPIVLESRDLPADKACGEGVMPAGVRLLEAMGVVLDSAHVRPFVGIRFVDGDAVAEARFRSGHGLGIRRTELSRAMTARAIDLGVDLRRARVFSWKREPDGVVLLTDSGPVHAKLLVAADGLHSRLRREAGLEIEGKGRPRYGIRRHYAIAPWTDHVEVHWADGLEAYVTPVGADETGVALLWNGSGGGYDELLSRLPALAQRLEGAKATSATRGAGPFRQGVSRRYGDGIALVGDAAGYLDALTGEGITLAFTTAEALCDVLARGAPLEEYEREYRRRSRVYYTMTSLLLRVTETHRLRRLVMGTLATFPRLLQPMLWINAGELRSQRWRHRGTAGDRALDTGTPPVPSAR